MLIDLLHNDIRGLHPDADIHLIVVHFEPVSFQHIREPGGTVASRSNQGKFRLVSLPVLQRNARHPVSAVLADRPMSCTSVLNIMSMRVLKYS